MDQQDTFRYTYSAKEQEEVRRIRAKYAPKPEQPEDKLVALRRLDEGVQQKAMAGSLSAGVIGALLLGIGMCCCMVWGGIWMFVGIPVGLLGIAAVAAAYPLHLHIIRKERAKIAPEILRLTDELMK